SGHIIHREKTARVSWSCPGFDFNGNGVPEVIIHSGDPASKADLSVLDGMDGSVLWKYRPSAQQNMKTGVSSAHTAVLTKQKDKSIFDLHYVVPADDITKDGVPELAIFRRFIRAGETYYYKIDVFDVASHCAAVHNDTAVSGSPVETYEIGRKDYYFDDNNYLPGGSIYFTGNKIIDADNMVSVYNGSHVYLISYLSGVAVFEPKQKAIYIYNSDMEQFQDDNMAAASTMILISRKYNSTMLSAITQSIFIENPVTDESKSRKSNGNASINITSPLKLAWTWPEGSKAGNIAMINVNGGVAARTRSNFMILDLKTGNNNISISVTDAYGRTETAAIDIIVVKNDFYVYILAMIILSVLVAMMAPEIFRIAELSGLRRKE
ncbi:MAG: hypothetical protein PHG48_07990, partial [Eubacteriales bacterium]|nr:hypothetical protein [Eubacteriales bacterium]